MWFKSRHALPDQAVLQAAAEDFLTGEGAVLENLLVRDRTVTAILKMESGEGQKPAVLQQKIEQFLLRQPGVAKTQVMITADVVPSAPAAPSMTPATRRPPAQIEGLATGVKHIIAVASGKGGVGKSTVAVNLAVALAAQGVKTGLLDADIYGPSVPMMMGIAGQKPAFNDQGKLIPIVAYGVPCMSIGLMVDTGAPMIWRGPMVQTAIVQLLRDVDWAGTDGLDVLVIDLPPGTGDAQLTMAQKLKLSGAIIVSTPQDVALIDARKGLEMFRKTGVPILGLVENMSVFCCPNCGHESPIFGAGGARDLATRENISFLGALPLDPSIREQGDMGVPAASTIKGGPIYHDLARAIQARLMKAV